MIFFILLFKSIIFKICFFLKNTFSLSEHRHSKFFQIKVGFLLIIEIFKKQTLAVIDQFRIKGAGSFKVIYDLNILSYRYAMNP